MPVLQRLRPGWTATILFCLLFSGPPSFRIRDPEASLDGEIDYVVILRLLVIMGAAFWVLCQWRNRSGEDVGNLPFKLRLPQKLGLLVIACLALSIFSSSAPALSAFKVCEMLVTFSFTTVFVETYGIGECLSKILLACAILCVAIAVCAFVAPDLVVFPSETGADRLRGELIAPTEIVAVFAIILLSVRSKRILGLGYLLLLAFFGTLAAFSLSRTAYLILAVFFGLYLWRLKRKLYTYLATAIALIFILYDMLPSLDAYRNVEGLFTLSDRLGLWAYLADVTLQKSPWIGLGYYSASRIYGREYSEDLGTAHSMFFESFVGGGFLGLVAVVALCLVIGIYAVRLLSYRGNITAFGVAMMLVATLMFGSIGGDFGYGPLGVTFWSLVTIVPLLHENLRIHGRTSRIAGYVVRPVSSA